MNNHMRQNVKSMEAAIGLCSGRPKGKELPQVAILDEVIVDVLHSCTGKSVELLDLEIHNQIDPSYQH